MVPTLDTIESIPRASCGEYELTDKEAKTLRSRIYSLNKNNARGWRWRTMRDGSYIIVWRIT